MSIVLMIVFEIISAAHDIWTKLNETGCDYDYDMDIEERDELEEQLDEYEEELCV